MIENRGVLSLFKMSEFVDFEHRPPAMDKAKQLLAGLVIPSGWVGQNKANYAKLISGFSASYDPSERRLSSDLFATHSKILDEVFEREPVARAYMLVTQLAVPRADKAFKSTARQATRLDAATLALALERHRAAQGAYPENLTALVPDYVEKVPRDPFDGQPLRYRRTEDGKYLLYSIGWDSRDDGGISGTDSRGKPLTHNDALDWVWQGVPAKKNKSDGR